MIDPAPCLLKESLRLRGAPTFPRGTADSWGLWRGLRPPGRGFCGGREGFLGGGPEDRGSGVRGRAGGRELGQDEGLGCRGMYNALREFAVYPKPGELSWSPKSGRNVFSRSYVQQTVGKMMDED